MNSSNGRPGHRVPQPRGRHIHQPTRGRVNGYELHSREDARSARVVVIALAAISLPGAALVWASLWVWAHGWPSWVPWAS